MSHTKKGEQRAASKRPARGAAKKLPPPADPVHPVQLKERFIEALAESGVVKHACEVAGLVRKTAYRWRLTDEAFRRDWDEAATLGTAALEDEAVRRAMHGTERPVFHAGKIVGHVRDYSDTLLIFLLKARKPEVFRDNFVKAEAGPEGEDRPPYKVYIGFDPREV